MHDNVIQTIQNQNVLHKTRLLWIPLWMSIFAVLLGCTPTAGTSPQPQDIVVHQTLSKQTHYAENSTTIYDASQMGVGFVRPEDRNTPVDQLPQNDEFQIDSSQLLSLDLVLISGQTAPFIVTTLLDYTQVPFTLDGTSGLLHEVTVEAGKALYIPIQVKIREAGAHDLIFAVFKNPFQRPLDHSFRSFDQCLFSGRRTVVVVDKNEKPVHSAQPDVTSTPPPASVDWGPPMLLANSSDIHPSEPNGQLPMVVSEKAGADFVFRVWMSNLSSTNPQPADYALVQFLNFHQVKIQDKNAMIVHLDAKQEAILKNHVLLPDRAGTNEFQIMYVQNPYKSLARNEVGLPFVYGSTCLAFQTTN